MTHRVERVTERAGLCQGRTSRWLCVLALTPLALLVIASPVAAKPKPIVALAPVDTLITGQRELVGVAVAPADATAYVSDRKDGTVLRLTSAGHLTLAVAGLRRPAGLALDPDGRLLIAEEKRGRVLRLEPRGPLTVLASGLKRPRWVVAAPDGTLYIAADRLRQRADGDEDDDRDDDADDDGPRMVVRRDPVTGALTVVASGLRGLQALALNGHVLYAAVKRVVALAPVEGAVARYPCCPGGPWGPRATW